MEDERKREEKRGRKVERVEEKRKTEKRERKRKEKDGEEKRQILRIAFRRITILVHDKFLIAGDSFERLR